MRKHRFAIRLLLGAALWAGVTAGAGKMEVQAAQPTGIVQGPPAPEETETVAPEGTDALQGSTFACYVTDPNGNRVLGYRAPQDGITYLFLPRSVDISTLELTCEGSVQGVSKGKWDPRTGIWSGAFRKSGDTAVAHLTAGDAQVTVLQSELPSVQLQLHGTTLETVQLDKNIKYPGNSLYLTNTDGTTDVIAEDSLECKGRGNSSWKEYDKKGYQIKFAEKTSVLGMKAAKKWILLANASDDSLMRNMIALDLSKELEMAYTTDYRYVDLWIDGGYQGTYLIGEKAEIGGSRLDLEDGLGVLMELDNAFYAEEDFWFYESLLDAHYTVKESVEEEDENQIRYAMASFQNALEQFALYLYQTPSGQVTLEALSSLIDVDSFAKYYLITEYALNREANNSSFYWYKDGESDVLHLGPVWDFDTCMGNEDLDVNQYYEHLYNPVMNRLLASPAFYGRVKEIRNRYDAAFRKLAGRVDSYQKQIGTSAYMNYIRWNTLGGTNPKGYSDFADTYGESVSNLKNWLSGRYRTFRPQQPEVWATMNETGTALIVHTAVSKGTNLQAAVWSIENGQDDLQWISGPVMENGEAVFYVDLSAYQSLGLYQIHLYEADGENYRLLDTTVYFRFL